MEISAKAVFAAAALLLHVCVVDAWITRTAPRPQPQPHRSLTLHAQKKVVVAGGGFGGLTFCKEASYDKVTLIEPNERFCFLPLLYEYVIGNADLDEIAPTYNILMPSTKQEQAYITKVDADLNQVHFRNANNESSTVTYDALVIASGMPPPRKMAPPESAFPFSGLKDATRLKRRLGALRPFQKIVVVGGGYVGTELACTLADSSLQADITMLHRDPTGVCGAADPFNRKVAMDRLTSLGVKVELGANVSNVESLDGGRSNVCYVKDNDDICLQTDLLIWTVAGSTSSARPSIEGLPLDNRGRIPINSSCQVEGLDNVYAIGDACSLSNSSLPSTAQVAMQQAAVVAHNIQSDNNKRQFQYNSLGEMMSLGDKSAAVASGPIQFKGPLASTARRLVYAARMPSLQQSLRAGAGYVTTTIEDRIAEVINSAVPSQKIK